MQRKPMSRRSILRAGAGISLALPLLDAMRPVRPAKAQGKAKRMVAWVQPLSIYADVFWPASPGAKPYDWKTDPISETRFSGQGALDNPSFALPEMLSFMQPHRDDLIFVEGLDNSASNHDAYSTTLTGTNTLANSPANMISIDQLIAKQVGAETKFRSLQVGVMNAGSDNKSAASWLSKTQAAPATDNPQRLWERLFADASGNPDEARRLRERNQSVLDAALEQADALKAELGKADKDKVDQYLDAFREVERRLDAAPQMGCQPPAKPNMTSPTTGEVLFEEDELRAIADVPTVMKMQLDMLAMALACDMTRVATFQYGAEANNGTFPWLGLPDWRWHDASHFENDNPAQWPAQLDNAKGWRAVAEWSLSQFNYLIERLKGLGAFDDTVLVFLTSMNHGGAHKSRNCPILIAGNGGGALKTGRHVRYEHDKNGGSSTRAFNDLHLTLARAMGVQLESFGDANKSKGVLAELLR